tara:strand:- start:1103 stop:1576 length:474 start_codon:yes stop_codon:yes gene_type:complete
MKARHQRMLGVGLALLGVAIAAGLTLKAFDENMMFFVEISDVVAGDYPSEKNFRIGGLVVENSIERDDGSLDMKFRVTDTRCELNVIYSGVLPDLFREGQGVVAHGYMGSKSIFYADKILAKHDENYMAPEVAASIAKQMSEKIKPLQKESLECNTG